MYEDSLHKASDISLTRIKNEFKRTKEMLTPPKGLVIDRFLLQKAVYGHLF